MQTFVVALIVIVLSVIITFLSSLAIGYAAGLVLAWLVPTLNIFFVGVTGVGLDVIVMVAYTVLNLSIVSTKGIKE